MREFAQREPSRYLLFAQAAGREGPLQVPSPLPQGGVWDGAAQIGKPAVTPVLTKGIAAPLSEISEWEA